MLGVPLDVKYHLITEGLSDCLYHNRIAHDGDLIEGENHKIPEFVRVFFFAETNCIRMYE